jgi:hypothetical protein
MRTVLLSCLLMLGCDTTMPPQQTVYRVYFLGGQSNMAGFGHVQDLPLDLQAPLPEVLIFQSTPTRDDAPAEGRGRWTQLQPGHGAGFFFDGTANHYSDRFGPELTFARRMQQHHPGQRIALIKYAKGGTALDTLAAGTAGAWDPDYRGRNGINQYDHALATLHNALAHTDIDGDGGVDVLVPAGILWMQGEADATVDASLAQRYAGHLQYLMTLLRAALGNSDLPVAVGRISDSGQDADGRVWTFGEIVREGQAHFVAADGHAALITSTDGYAYTDPWHYDSAGYLDLGQQFADALHALETR